jgi:hypothetical protein
VATVVPRDAIADYRFVTKNAEPANAQTTDVAHDCVIGGSFAIMNSDACDAQI